MLELFLKVSQRNRDSKLINSNKTLKYSHFILIYMISFKEVNVLDRNASYLGVPTFQLMENAGKSVAENALQKFDVKGKKVLILCGAGNNGGDGFVAAWYLKEHCDVHVVLLKPKTKISTKLARSNLERIKEAVKLIEDPLEVMDDLEGNAVIIDAMLGIGISGDLREPYATCIQEVNESGIPVLSVDVPSGFGTNIVIKPHTTVTFHDIKEGMTRENSGEIIITDIGIPEDAEKYLGPGEFVFYPRPREESHKGDNGRLLIIGGGPYTGAPALAGIAAYRIGVDLVHIATPAKTYEIIASYSPNFIVHRLESDIFVSGDVQTLTPVLDNVDAVVIGPGLGRDPSTKEAVRDFIKNCSNPILIDADGLEAVSEDLSCIKGKVGVLTPHGGEFKKLSKEDMPDDIEDVKKKVKEFSLKSGMTVLLKGATDVISDGQYMKLNRSGNPGMTVGGTGDVLAGIVGGLLSKGVTPFNAARIGAFTNGYAGDLSYAELGYSMTSTDIIEKIHEVLDTFLSDEQ
jgi:NAD(P)H-hydrate epimerase